MNGRRTKLTPLGEVLEATAKRTVVYRCVNTKTRKLENAKRDQVGEKPWNTVSIISTRAIRLS